MELRVLGPPEFGSGAGCDISGKEVALLVALLLRRAEPVAREELIEDLWGMAPPPTVVNALQVHVSRLRRSLAAAGAGTTVLTTSEGYAIQIGERDWLDLESFERLAAAARAAAAAGEQAEAASTARRALALWRGSAAAGVLLEGRARQELARLDELKLDVLALRLAADLASGGHEEVIAELAALTESNPLDERFRRQLMLALYRSGRQGEALDVYRDTWRTLADTLGIDPSPDLRRLERAILAQDEALDLERPTTVPQAERRTVAVVVVDADIDAPVDIDPEREAVLQRRWLKVAGRTFKNAGAKLVSLPTGDAYAVFGAPAAHEDDARVAAQAALDVCRRLGAYADRLDRRDGIRLTFSIGIASGETIVGPDGAHATRTTRTAAALARLAAPRTILLTQTTQTLLGRDAFTERVAMWNGDAVLRLVDLTSHSAGGRVVLVDRERELEPLVRVVERGLAGPLAAITILGPAGIGKSVLVDACTARYEDAAVLRVHCAQPLHGLALQPLREAVEHLTGAPVSTSTLEALFGGGDDAPRAAEVLLTAFGSAELAASPGEVSWAVTHLLGTLASRGLVLVLEDLQLAKAQLLEFLGTALHRLRSAHVAVVCVIRTASDDAGAAEEFARSLAAEELELHGLSDAAAAELLDGLTADTPLATPARDRVLAAAEGNPLFINQLVAHLADESPGAKSALPPTVQALLSARLGALSAAERAFLSRAAVGDRDFTLALIAVLSEASEAEVAEVALSLVRRKLLEDTGVGYRFRHALVRETAYDATPKRTRAALHEAVARWVDANGGSAAAVGLHLAEAVALRRELGGSHRQTDRLAERAATLIAAGGREANGRGRVAEALDLFRRAVGLVDPNAASAPSILCDYAEAQREFGDRAAVEATLSQALAAAIAHGDEVAEERARIARIYLLSADASDFGGMVEELDRSIAVLERHGATAELAEAWHVLSFVHWLRCRATESSHAALKSVRSGRQVGDLRWHGLAIHMLLGAAVFGPMHVDAAARRCRRVLVRYPGRQRVAASSMRALAALLAYQGRFDEAGELMRRDREITDALGLRLAAASAGEIYARVHLLAGDYAAAEEEIERAAETLGQMGDYGALSTLLAVLAEVLYAQGGLDEALEATVTAERYAGGVDVHTQVQYRVARAKILAAQDDHSAEHVARAALELARGTDFISMEADAYAALGEVQLLLNRKGVAATFGRAVALYERKGNSVAAEKVRLLLSERRKASRAVVAPGPTAGV